jgi:hypothetical protein
MITWYTYIGYRLFSQHTSLNKSLSLQNEVQNEVKEKNIGYC